MEHSIQRIVVSAAASGQGSLCYLVLAAASYNAHPAAIYKRMALLLRQAIH
jgi:hypothetical protein